MTDPAPDSQENVRCDFCGETVASVRRVALDGAYDRLGVRHAVRYACPECSERKERERLGTAGPGGAGTESPGRSGA